MPFVAGLKKEFKCWANTNRSH